MKRRFAGVLVALLLMSVAWPARVGAQDGDAVAVVLKVTKDVRERAPGASDWKAATKGQILVAGDQLRTREGAFCAIIFTDDKSLLKITENSEVEIRQAVDTDGDGRLSKKIWVGVGGVYLQVTGQEQPRFAIETPTSVAFVKGSQGYDIVDSGGFSTLYGVEGVWEFSNPFGTVSVNPGFQAFSNGQDPPTLRRTPPGQTPTFNEENPEEGSQDEGGPQGGQGGQELRIGMEDKDGTQRTLIIRYRDKSQE